MTPEFLEISPNNKIPAIVDRDNRLKLMESGAIMIYLAENMPRKFPNVRGWYRRILEREAVQRGYHVPNQVNEIPPC